MSDSATRKTFSILLGDSSELVEEIRRGEGFKAVMGANRKDGWTLYRTNIGYYWDIDPEVGNIQHQFMMVPRGATVYIFFSYRQKDAMEQVKKLFKLAKQDLGTVKEKKYFLIGLNFSGHKLQKPIKKEVIKWAIDLKEDQGIECGYSDLEDLTADW